MSPFKNRRDITGNTATLNKKSVIAIEIIPGVIYSFLSSEFLSNATMTKRLSIVPVKLSNAIDKPATHDCISL